MTLIRNSVRSKIVSNAQSSARRFRELNLQQRVLMQLNPKKPILTVSFAAVLAAVFLWYAIPVFYGKNTLTQVPYTASIGTHQEVRTGEWTDPETGKVHNVEILVDVPFAYTETSHRTVFQHDPLSLKAILVLSIITIATIIVAISAAATAFQVYRIESKTGKDAPKSMRERNEKLMILLVGMVVGFVGSNQSSDVLIPTSASRESDTAPEPRPFSDSFDEGAVSPPAAEPFDPQKQ